MNTQTQHKGTTYVGTQSFTNNQIKKHISKITPAELAKISEILDLTDFSKIRLSKHIREKLEVSFDIYRITELLASKNVTKYIIELNANFIDENDEYPNDVRILVRDPDTYYSEITDKNTGRISVLPCNMCFVYSLTKNRLVTVYWNKCTDNHRTLNIYRYSDEDFLPYLKQLYKRKRTKKRYMFA